MKTTTVFGLLCLGILCLAGPTCWDQFVIAVEYWRGDQALSGPYSAPDSAGPLAPDSAGPLAPDSAGPSIRDPLIAIALAASSMMVPIGLSALAVDHFGGPAIWKRVLMLWAVASLVCFVGCQLALYNSYGGSGRQLGQISLAIHSGTTFCIIGLFVIYRFFETRRADRPYARLFEYQLVVMCLGPFLYRVAYGIWFLIAGHEFDGSYGQQVVLSFGSFLVPLLAVYVGTFLYSRRPMPWSHATILSSAVIGIITIGVIGYAESNVQPAMV